MKSISDKWDAIYSQQNCDSTSAAKVLRENIHLLPDSGTALDLACGLGGNAIEMARQSLSVDAWDVSSVGLDKISEYSNKNKLNIKVMQRDVESNPPPCNSYDVIVVTYFLYRPIVKQIVSSLKKDGLLFYQTFTREKTIQIGPTNPKYLLNKNELLDICEGMNILVYREESLQGNITEGWRNEAMIIAKKIN